MIRIGLALSFILFLTFSQAQAQIPELVKTFESFEQKGQFDDAAAAAIPIIEYWKKLVVADSIYFYRYKRIHMLGQGSHYAEAIGEMKPLIRELEALPVLPSFMGQVYYSAARDRLFLAAFDDAENYYDKSILFERSRTNTDTFTLAKSIEWKGILYNYTGDLEQAVLLNEEALNLRYAIFDSSAKEIAYNLNSLGSIYTDLGDVKKGEKAYREAFRIFKLQLDKNHPHTWNVASNLSASLGKLGNITGAIDMLDACIRVHEQQGLYHDLMSEYFNMGTYYNALNHADRAMPYMLKSLAIADSILPKPHFSRANIYDGIGGLYLARSKYQLADSLFTLALQERDALGEIEGSKTGQSRFNLALAAQSFGDLERAAALYKISHEERAAVLGLSHAYTLNSLFGLADIQFVKGEYANAIQNFKTCYLLYDSKSTGHYKWSLEAGLRLAEAYHATNQPDSAYQYLKNAWADALHASSENLNLKSLSESEILIINPIVLRLIAFHADFIIDRFRAKDGQQRQEAFELIKTSDSFVDKLWPFLVFENINEDLMADIQAMYERELVLETLLDAGDGKMTHWYLKNLEQSRSISIRAALQNRRSMKFANVPDSVVEKDRMLREKLRYIQANSQNNSEGHWQQLQFETLQAWSDYQQELSTAYPTWYATRYEKEISSEDQLLREIQHSDASLLVYFAVDNGLKVLKSNGTAYQMIDLGVPPTWADSVIAYRSVTELNKDPKRLASLGYYLYRILWKPIETELKEHVVILPDGVLHKLNFETLLNAPPASSSYSDWPWLLKMHNILLRNSLTVSPADRKKKTTGILALVPGFSDDVKAKFYAQSGVQDENNLPFRDFVQTPFSVEFARRISDKGRSMIGLDANEQNFRHHGKDAEVLHFGTHAILKDNDPLGSYLALTPAIDGSDDGYLHAYELFNQPLAANLAVLTACETGLGYYRHGDGVISLAYAFEYAGCPNVLYSLWKIDDKQSTWIVNQFYTHLEDPVNFSSALRKAKLDYLQNFQGELAAPYYWGGLVLTGQDGQLTQATSWWWLIGAVLILITVTTIWILMQKRRQKTRIVL